jgi:hypothetical protein
MDEMAELQMPLLGDAVAHKLLLRHALAGQPASHAKTLPTSISEDLVHEVTRECGGLPLCLMLTGSAICTEGADLPSSWENFRDKLRVLPSHGVDHTSLSRCKLSYDVLTPALKQRMQEWAPFPEDEPLPVESIVSDWSAFLPLLPSSTDTLQYGQLDLQELKCHSLVFHDEASRECYVHDIVWSMMKQECEDSSKTVGEQFAAQCVNVRCMHSYELNSSLFCGCAPQQCPCVAHKSRPSAPHCYRASL